MQTTSARPLWPLHAFAIPLIAVFGWLIYDEKSRDFTPQDTESLAKTLVSSRELMEKSNVSELHQIQKTSKDYPNAHNDEWVHRAERAAALAQKMRQQAEVFYQAKQFPLADPSSAPPAALPDIAALADSLILLTGNDSAATIRIRTCLFDENRAALPTWWGDVLWQNNKETMALWYNNLMSKITLAEEVALRHIAPKVCADVEYVFDAFEIDLVPGKTRRIHPGEPFEADVYLASYSRRSDNIRIFANNKQLPVENGKALFSQIYRTPGEKIVDVRIEIHNQVTGRVERIQKQFSVEVLPKCEPKH